MTDDRYEGASRSGAGTVATGAGTGAEAGTGARTGAEAGTGARTGAEAGAEAEAGAGAASASASTPGAAVPSASAASSVSSASAASSEVSSASPAAGWVAAGPVRVMLADDEHLIRGALAALLGLEDDLQVVAEAASGPEAVAMARTFRPDVAVLDLQMPGADGVMVATTLRAELPGCRTMIVTGHGRPGHLKRALEAGVRGFVPKTVSAQRLAEIIRSVHAGSRYVDPELAADAISAGDSPLTAREAELLELAEDGAPVAEIAERASLTPGTVRNYLSAAVAKLGVENRHAAARIARAQGWL